DRGARFSASLGATFDLGKVIAQSASRPSMDEKDFRLLAAVHRDARQSYQSLARRVSLTAPAARDRLKRLESSGVLRGYGLWIDPGVFGLDEVLAFFRSPR